MQVEAVGRPIKYTRKSGEIYRLRPGVPIDLPDHIAQQLLKKAGDKVRIARLDVTIHSASPEARAVYWEAADGRILGPAKLEFLAKIGTGLKNTYFWLVVLFEHSPQWIRSDRLRSKQAFDTQRPVQRIEPIREVWSGR